MPGYNLVKTQKALPVGSVQPWGGALSSIPNGWLLCNNQELNANDYPLLARVLRDTYGGTGFSGIFPNYSGTFRLPLTNDKALADISTEYFGVYSGAGNTTPWSSGATVQNGDIITHNAEFYSVELVDDTALSGQLGTSAPTHTSGISPNGSEVNLKFENIVPGTVPSPIDNPEALSKVSEYIGTSVGGFEPGDLGPPNVQPARTDINFEYVPDPSGSIVTIAHTGTAPSATTSQSYTITASDVIAGTNSNTGDPVLGTGSAYGVVVNTDGTYSVKVIQKGENYEINDVVKIQGDNFTNGTTPANDISITVSQVGNSNFEGTITGQSMIKGFGIEDVYIVPRKLGRDHFPQHYHEGTYETTNFNDASDRPGQGVGVFANPEFTFVEGLERLNPCPPENIIFGVPVGCPITVGSYGILQCSPAGPVVLMGGYSGSDSNPKITAFDASPFSHGPGRFAIGTIMGGLPIQGYKPFKTAANGHGIGKTWFKDARNLRDGANNVSFNDGALNGVPSAPTFDQKLADLQSTGRIYPGYRIPFSDDTSVVGAPNYYDGTNDIVGGEYGPFPILMNHAGLDFLNDDGSGAVAGVQNVIESHDHDGSFAVQYDGDALDIIEQLQIEAQPSLTPDNLADALQITFTTRVASLTCVHLIRAY